MNANLYLLLLKKKIKFDFKPLYNKIWYYIMLNKIKEYIKKYELKEGDSVLLACSGGIDSMVLFDILQKLNIDFCVAHCNFMLRGD